MNRLTIATAFLLWSSSLTVIASAADHPGAAVVSYYGYKDCIELKNETSRVVLCPAAGGRVLEYSLGGKNALYLPPGNEGWTYEPGKKGGSVGPGRFDIGPETTTPSHPVLWHGRWTGEIIGARSARLTSQKDKPTGVQLIREFVLDETSSRLSCTQTIINVSDATKEYCHWSRTFALGGGICVIPLTPPSRFPKKYVMYVPAPLINYEPEDPHIRERDGFLEITGVPKYPKLGMDTQAGWFAYVMKNDLMFVKEFPVDRDRVYNEVAGLTMSIWYPDRPMCELEPIGPRERLEPGDRASFTEVWSLIPWKYPKKGDQLDLPSIAEKVGRDQKKHR